jgi:ribosomal protein L11 methylase PrmA
MGANVGVFSRIASRRNIATIAFDIDPAAVESNYRQIKSQNESSILPLIMDLTNPSASLGWSNEERNSLIGRGPVDCVMVLALVHHLAITNNLPNAMIAEFFAKIGNWLIIEFVPKSDSQVQRLLRTRVDIFNRYNEVSFEDDFSRFFKIEKKTKIAGSNRTLYLMKSI